MEDRDEDIVVFSWAGFEEFPRNELEEVSETEARDQSGGIKTGYFIVVPPSEKNPSVAGGPTAYYRRKDLGLGTIGV